MRHLSNQIILLFYLFTLANYSQDLISFHNSGNFQLIQKLSFYDINIKGTPFIFEDFVTGKIVFESGKTLLEILGWIYMLIKSKQKIMMEKYLK